MPAASGVRCEAKVGTAASESEVGGNGGGDVGFGRIDSVTIFPGTEVSRKAEDGIRVWAGGEKVCAWTATRMTTNSPAWWSK